MSVKELFKEKKYQILLAVLIVVMAGLFFLLKYVYMYNLIKTIRYLILLPFLFVIAIIDAREMRIPNRILFIMILVRMIIFIAEFMIYRDSALTLFINSLAGGAAAGGLFGLCYIVSRKSIGAGDVKLLAVCGLFLGFSAIVGAIIMISLCALIYGIAGMILKKNGLKDSIPFGPFVLIGTVLAMVIGI